ncbi:alpha/beta fold hydrolase [Kitasatospora sp. LaBMicrA B282]|uniref:alpha/beta fold hydrolase n=1 Tax=Kitasatospora sp. LaBMicrA B282 TaxID=3420949 RepID=UPI003D0E5485
MHAARVTPAGAVMRWVEIAGEAEPARVYLHGLGAAAAPYFTGSATHPALAGHRSLLVDLLGFGLSDRPADFGYSLEEHADTVAVLLREAGVAGADVIAHSMGGSVAILLAARHPELVARLVLIDANLDPVVVRPGAIGSSGIASYTEAEFLAGGLAEVRERVGAHWWSTMRLADPLALHRSAVRLARGSEPTMREQLVGLKVPRSYLFPADEGEPAGRAQLAAAGVEVLGIPDCGHNIMLDNTEAFVAAVAGFLAGS